MLKYFISILCLTLSIQHSLYAQKEIENQPIKDIENKAEITKAVETIKDSINPFYNPKTYGLRIGLDIIKPIYSFTKDHFSGFEIAADYRIKTNLFIAGEMGYTDKTIQEDEFNHSVDGSYLKLGINYNLYTNWLDMDNELYLGTRYGFSTFTNTLNNYTIFQEGNFFDEKEVNTPVTYDGLNAHWFEFVAGIKVEVFKNIYFGFMASLNKLITTKEPSNFGNTYSPGFGGISKNGSGANINYTITYRIPLYKK